MIQFQFPHTAAATLRKWPTFQIWFKQKKQISWVFMANICLNINQSFSGLKRTVVCCLIGSKMRLKPLSGKATQIIYAIKWKCCEEYIALLEKYQNPQELTNHEIRELPRLISFPCVKHYPNIDSVIMNAAAVIGKPHIPPKVFRGWIYQKMHLQFCNYTGNAAWFSWVFPQEIIYWKFLNKTRHHFICHFKKREEY